ncbi:uncharacterized protein [Coffea arabica]|uniref:Uncharacterized protein isoform X4 n=1 Tax=Coffea arabica TaxID=13443 RepID=A0ABM4WB61_COFAR
MAETHIQVADVPEEESHSRQLQDQTPLLKVEQTHQSQNQETTEEDQEAYTPLDKTLKTLDSFLALLGFKQNSILSVGLSWMVFLLIGFFLPVVILQLSNCPGCEKGQIKSFELDIVASQASLASASLICVSHNLRKYGIRKFLFVDRYTGHVERFSDQYIQKISESVRLLVLWVSSIVQVAGITLCLNAAAKISHRAQGIGSLASQWHALRTCTPTDASQFRIASSTGSLEVDHMIGSLYTSYSESDLESLEFVPTSQSTPLSSYASSYHKRQALVTYLQSNPGGITVFGWTVDRGLINTIFFIQLSLVLFVLGKTVVFTSQ